MTACDFSVHVESANHWGLSQRRSECYSPRAYSCGSQGILICNCELGFVHNERRGDIILKILGPILRHEGTKWLAPPAISDWAPMITRANRNTVECYPTALESRFAIWKAPSEFRALPPRISFGCPPHPRHCRNTSVGHDKWLPFGPCPLWLNRSFPI